MEHLRLPAKPSPKPLDVPCISSARYEPGPFLKYPKRIGFSGSDEGLDSVHGVPTLDLLQTWLYFGALHEVFHRHGLVAPEIDLRDTFTRSNEAGDRFISTAKLRGLFDGVLESLERAGPSFRERYCRSLLSVLQQSHYILADLRRHLLSAADQLVVLSMHLLYEFIVDELDLTDIEPIVIYERSTWLEEQMIAAGWCPSDVERLANDMNLSVTMYIYNLGAPPCPKPHIACGKIKCFARQIRDDEEYEPKHTSAACDCQYLIADQATLLRCLWNDQVPVAIAQQSDETCSLEIVSAADVARYVAVSHVWSDKLGNRTQNAMPLCQLQRIQTLVNNLYEEADRPVAFWVDTLSCPVEPDDATDKAIALMRSTYADADRVLVLDSYLEREESREMIGYECALRIACCGWTRRLWTLQEGVLAKQIYFQFADEALDGDALFDKIRQPPSPYWIASVFHQWFDLRLSWNRTLDLGSSEYVWMLWRALRFRTTSVSTDEALCLSTLANVDIHSGDPVPPEGRMKKLWSCISKLSTALLYWNGPRLSDVGYRWAPRSLLSTPPDAFTIHSPDQLRHATEATRTQAGIVFPSAGITLGPWRTSLRKSFWLQDETGTWYFVDVLNPVGPPRSLHGSTAISGQLVGWSGDSPPPQNLALLMYKPLRDCFLDPSYIIGRSPPSCSLVSIYGYGHGAAFASFESPAAIRMLPPREMDASGLDVVSTVQNIGQWLQEKPNTEVSSGESDNEASGNLADVLGDCEFDVPHHLIEPEHVRKSIQTDFRLKGLSHLGHINLIVNDEHMMFHGIEFSRDTIFCID